MLWSKPNYLGFKFNIWLNHVTFYVDWVIKYEMNNSQKETHQKLAEKPKEIDTTSSLFQHHQELCFDTGLPQV